MGLVVCLPAVSAAVRIQAGRVMMAEAHGELPRGATPPPPGWRPLGSDDELLLALLPDEEV
jgi:hypothetical protein